jgi:hypothetical protein
MPSIIVDRGRTSTLNMTNRSRTPSSCRYRSSPPISNLVVFPPDVTVLISLHIHDNAVRPESKLKTVRACNVALLLEDLIALGNTQQHNVPHPLTRKQLYDATECFPPSYTHTDRCKTIHTQTMFPLV